MRRRRREPVWMERLVVDAVHVDQLREHGGLTGTRDENALESVLARPRNCWHHERRLDLAALGAAYAWGLATSHPYRDGNKRVAFLTMATFLELNGLALEAPDEGVVDIMLAVAGRRCSEDELAAWVRSHLAKRRR